MTPASQEDHGERSPARTLVVTRDPILLEELQRVAAVAGVTLDVEAGLPARRSQWSEAATVLVGRPDLEAVVLAAPPRRPRVLVVGFETSESLRWADALRLGAERMLVLPADEGILSEYLVDGAANGASAFVVGVIGGRGGAGASVLAAALAIGVGRAGLRALLVDADPLGGGLDLLLGVEEREGLRWPDLAGARGRLGPHALDRVLTLQDGLRVVSHGRAGADPGSVPPEAVAAVLGAGTRSCDVIVIDLPRQIDAAAEQALMRCTVLLIVVPAEVRAAAAAGVLLRSVSRLAADVRVVVRGPAASGFPAEALADALALPLLARLPVEPGLPAALDRGEPPGRERGPLASSAVQMLGELLGRSLP